MTSQPDTGSSVDMYPTTTTPRNEQSGPVAGVAGSQPALASQLDPAERDGGLSAPVLAALERVWAGIQARHPEVPRVVVVLAAGSIGAPRGTLRLGHFAAMRWHHDTTVMPEVMVGGEGLARGPRDVLGTLLHEAAHALAHTRAVKDTSRQGRYHNAAYAALARELGLDVAQTGTIGWSDTTVTDQTAAAYADELADLAVALVIHRRAEGAPITGPGGTDDNNDNDNEDGDQGGGTGGKANHHNGTACTCACPRRIRVAPTVLALGPITCGTCGADFTPAAGAAGEG